MCIQGEKDSLITQNFFAAAHQILLDSLARATCDAHVYLFMPDHVHLLIKGTDDNSDLWKCVVDFKQRSGFWMSRNESTGEWQKGSYDHILRKEEDLETHVRYILNNPVRRGIVENWKDYPFKGSTIYDFEEW